MDEHGLFRGYEQRKNIGKIVGERKYSAMACKDIEKKLSCLSKRINDLENQRKCAYKNSFKIKKKIHNQTNQIVKCFRERERNLLCHVDEAYMDQDASLSEELSRLISTHACCQTLYTNIEDFRENTDVLAKINNFLCTINFNEKTAFKPLEFSSNFEQSKVDASNYGCLEGEFVERKLPAQSTEQNSSPAMLCKHSEDKGDSCKHCMLNNLETTFEHAKSLSARIPRRERTDSQDSFEIVDMLENIHCDDDKEFIMSEKDCISKLVTKNSAKNEEVVNSPEKPSETSNSAKYPLIEKQLVQLKQRLHGLSVSTAKLSPTQVNFRNTQIQSEKDEGFKKMMKLEYNSWLQKHGQRVDVMEVDKNKPNCYSTKNMSGSPADLIKKAFTPYLAEESIQNWLSN